MDAVVGRRPGRAGAPGGALRRAARPRRWRPRWTCSPGATRRPPSPSCARASSGTGPTDVAHRPAAARSSSRSPAAAPSPTGDCSASSWPAPSGPARVGELDEEMVYESRVGDVFLLGSTSWRIEEITPDRVLVSPAPGRAGPDAVLEGRPARPPGRAGPGDRGEAARGRQARPRAGRRRPAPTPAWTRGRSTTCCPMWTSSAQATRHLPDDRTVLVERFRDELGDWRLAVHCLLGAKVNGAWALAIGRRLTERYGVDAQVLPSDDGIVVRLPDVVDLSGHDAPPGADLVVFDPDEIAQLVEESIGGSAMFAARFRECAARSLLLPRRDPRRRQPLWQQRQRAAQLLDVAREFADFPVTLEAARECLQDVLDVPGLVELMRDVVGPAGPAGRGGDASGPRRSPGRCSSATSARSSTAATCRWPSAGRPRWRWTPPCSASCSAGSSCASCSTRRWSWRPSAGCSGSTAAGRLRDAEDAVELLRVLGDLSTVECVARGAQPEWLAELVRGATGGRGADRRRGAVHRRRGRRPGARRARRGAAGRPGRRRTWSRSPTRSATSSPATPAPTGRSPRRPARPGSASASSWSSRRSSGSPPTGRVTAGEFTPVELAGTDAGHRVVRRRGAAAAAPPLAGRAAPGDRAGTARRCWPRSCPAGSRSAASARGVEAVAAAIEQLQGVAIPASAWERLVLPARVADYTPAYLDELCASGEVVWAGAGSIPGGDGWIVFAWAEAAPLLLPAARPGVRRRRRCTTRCSTALGGGAGAVLPPARRAARADGAEADLAGGGVGPGLGRARLQRHARPGAGAARRRRGAPGEGRPRRGRGTARPARLPASRLVAASLAAARSGPPSVGRPLVPAARPGRQPDPARHRAGRGAARTPRRADPGRGDGRGHARRVRRGLPGAGRAGGARRGPPRLLRRGPGRGPVRRARRGRPAAGARRRPGRPGSARPRRPRRARSCWPRPTRPTRTAPRCRGRSGSVDEGEPGTRPPARAQGRRAGRHGRRRAGASTSSAAAGPYCPIWTIPRRSARPRRRWPARSAAARSGRSRWSGPTAATVHATALGDALTVAGFRATPRGLRLRA